MDLDEAWNVITAPRERFVGHLRVLRAQLLELEQQQDGCGSSGNGLNFELAQDFFVGESFVRLTPIFGRRFLAKPIHIVSTISPIAVHQNKSPNPRIF